jgi:hypothetical protein
MGSTTENTRSISQLASREFWHDAGDELPRGTPAVGYLRGPSALIGFFASRGRAQDRSCIRLSCVFFGAHISMVRLGILPVLRQVEQFQAKTGRRAFFVSRDYV